MSRETSRGRATVRQICQAFGVSRQAYYAALRAPEEKPRSVRSRSARPGPWATTAELEGGIRRVVEAHAGWGVRKVWAYLRREKVVASRKRVYAVMKSLGLLLPPVKERDPEVRRGQVAVPDSNRRWASDLTTTWTRQDGTVALVPVIDCGDRMVFEIGIGKSQEAPEVLAPIFRSLHTEFERPDAVPPDLELRTDHGPQYTGADCEVFCEFWGLEHTLAPVGRPTGNAVAERFIQTLKVELLWTRDWDNIQELRLAVKEWLQEYNFRRPHQALGWQTPGERRTQNLGAIEMAVA